MSGKNLSQGEKRAFCLMDDKYLLTSTFLVCCIEKKKKNSSKFQLITTAYESKIDDDRVQGVVTSCYFHTQQIEISINIRIIECARG